MEKNIVLQESEDSSKIENVVEKSGSDKGHSVTKVNKKKFEKTSYAVGEVWNIFPVPLIMTELEARVRFYTVGSDDKPRRLVANGFKDRLSNKYQVMLMKGERKRLMSEYHISSNELYRYLNLELRRSVDMMELHSDKYLVTSDENDV